MILYSVDDKGVRDGVRLTNDDRFGWCLSLGSRGGSGWHECLKLDARDPAHVEAIGEERIVRKAELVEFIGGGKKRFALRACQPAMPGRTGVLVEVLAGPGTAPGCLGTVVPHAGEPERIVAGTVAREGARSKGAWEHSLWRMKQGDALRVTSASGGGSYLFVVEKVPFVMPFSS